MASTKQLVAPVLAILVSLHLLVWCGAARHHAKPGMRHRGHPSWSSPAMIEFHTPAVMTLNDFENKGGGGGGPAECDEQYHSNDDMLVALSTGWYAGGQRCYTMIRITTADTSRTVKARVVDECDSRSGCKPNMVGTSAAVWKALGLDTNIGEVPVTWSDV